MTKKDAINSIRHAAAAHMRWKNIAQVSITGLISDFNKVNLPILQTESEFGKWYYGEGMSLSMLPSYNTIEEPLENVFQTFLQIVALQRSKKKSGILSFGSDESKKKKELDAHTANFNTHNKILMDSLHALEAEVINLSEQEFSQLVNME